MLRRLGIRAKVLAVLAVPVLFLLIAASYISVQAVVSVRTAAAVEDVVTVLPKYADVVEALQQERTLSMAAVSGTTSDDLTTARSATDTAVTALTAATTDLDVGSLDAQVGDAITSAANGQDDLTDLRARVDAASIPSSLVDSNYTDIIAAANDVPALVGETLSERSLASSLTAYGLVADTIEQVLRAEPTAQAVFADDGADSDEVQELASLFAVQDEARDDARTATNNLRLTGIQVPSRNADLTAMQLSLVSGNQLTVSALDVERWNTLIDAELTALRPVATDLLGSASDQASALSSSAQREALITVAAAALATALSILIAFVVARGITIPLRRLTSAAANVREELPRLVEQVAVPGESPDLTLAEIPVESSDEVGRLAAAFNSVNATTIQVARDQAALRGSIAEMFVNVARRDQVLLGRQLAFIDSLERSEEDPAALANLFRLDHLATRMRRNAESLLVLAGIDSGRRLREAMPLSDVVRTASSEIEQYDRVQLELHADPLMHGFNALAAAHLLAELLENATLFSEPGTPVIVSTGVEGDLVTVRVIDQGLGMSPEELAEVNATIDASAATDAIGAQRLGLFVVARLAHRLGAQVRIERAGGTHSASGTVASVAFPAALFTSHDPALGGQPSARPAAVPPAPVPGALPAGQVPVDLAALTDGATSTGLPRRRVGGDAAPEEPEIVLPAPAETTLAPEITAASVGWLPAVVSDAPAALPSRSGAGQPVRTSAAGLPTRTPVAPAAPVVPAPTEGEVVGGTERRSGLFAGFRGRDALPQPAEPPQPGAATSQMTPALDLLAEPLADPTAWSDGPAVPDLAPVDGFAVPGLVEDVEPAVDPGVASDAALVVPGLVPDEPAPEEWAWPAAAPVVAEVPEQLPDTDAVLPSVEVPGWEVVQSVPDLLPTEPTTGWVEPAPADGWVEPAQAGGWAPTAPGGPTTDPGWPSTEPDGWSQVEPAAWSAPVEPAPAVPAPVADWTQAPPPVLPTWSQDEPATEGSAEVAPVSFTPGVDVEPAPAPVLPVRASAFSAPAELAPAELAPAEPAQDAAPLPDFASLLQGDEDETVSHRAGRKRSFFSFGRRRSARTGEDRTGTSPGSDAGDPTAALPTSGAWPALAPAPEQVAAGPVLPEPVAPGPFGAPADLRSVTPAAGTETLVGEPLPAPAEPSGWAQPDVGQPEQPAPVPGFGGWSPAAEPETAWAPQTAADPSDDWEPAVASLPLRTPAPVPPPVEDPTLPADRSAPRNVSAWASAWSPEGGAGSGSWSTDHPDDADAPAGTDTGRRSGALDVEAAAMLSMRADIQEQALSELSQLSAYRPTVVSRPANGSLTRRVPTAIPAAPEIAGAAEATAPRDADGLRDRLSSFQSGTRRGRRAQAGSPTGETSTPEAEPVESEQQPTWSSPSW
ncbi:MAG TPA: nitrate- and nitrite sensing domain-containing protein [Cellulomonas sp.]